MNNHFDNFLSFCILSSNYTYLPESLEAKVLWKCNLKPFQKASVLKKPFVSYHSQFSIFWHFLKTILKYFWAKIFCLELDVFFMIELVYNIFCIQLIVTILNKENRKTNKQSWGPKTCFIRIVKILNY